MGVKWCEVLSTAYNRCSIMLVQAHLGDITGLVPYHHNKMSITIKQIK